MNGKMVAQGLRTEKKFLMNIVKCFKPEHAGFIPAEGMMSVAQLIGHIAYTAKWFREGAFGDGFDMDFEKMAAENKKVSTLEEALARLDSEYDGLVEFLEPLGEDELAKPLPPNPLFGELPRYTVFEMQKDHTAHHRGALSVYLRLLGITPPMVYGEM